MASRSARSAALPDQKSECTDPLSRNVPRSQSSTTLIRKPSSQTCSLALPTHHKTGSMSCCPGNGRWRWRNPLPDLRSDNTRGPHRRVTFRVYRPIRMKLARCRNGRFSVKLFWPMPLPWSRLVYFRSPQGRRSNNSALPSSLCELPTERRA